MMENTYAEILADVMENGLVNVGQEREAMIAELEAEIEFACHEREFDIETTENAIEFALTHVGHRGFGEETTNESKGQSDMMIRVMSQEKIDALNEQMVDGKTAHEVARENGLELVRWDDESGGLYKDDDGYLVFGWEYGEAGFDDQVGNNDNDDGDDNQI